jgi:RHS repeat-associated protein
MNGRILYTRSPVARRVGRWPEASFGCHGARAGTAVSRTSNDFNQLTGVGGATLAYDSNGSMTTDDQGHTLTYDAWNRLVSVKNGGTTLATYAYDGAGRRVTATASGTTTDSYFSGSVVAEDYRGGQAYERTVAAPGYVDAVLLRDKDTDANGTLDQRVYFTADANANITGVLSASATVLQHQFYTAYGEVAYTDASWSNTTDAYGLSRLFQGMRYAAAIGWYVTLNRLYRAPLAYWNRVDPAQADGLNWYVPFAGNPVNRLDPSGLLGIPPHTYSDTYTDEQINAYVYDGIPLPTPPQRSGVLPNWGNEAGELHHTKHTLYLSLCGGDIDKQIDDLYKGMKLFSHFSDNGNFASFFFFSR